MVPVWNLSVLGCNFDCIRHFWPTRYHRLRHVENTGSLLITTVQHISIFINNKHETDGVLWKLSRFQMTSSADFPGGGVGRVFNNVLFDGAPPDVQSLTLLHTFHPIEKWYSFCIPSLENCISLNQKVFLFSTQP